MAGNNQGYMVTTIIFGVLLLVTGVGWYLTGKDITELKTSEASANAKATEADAALRTALDQITALKGMVGHQMENVGIGQTDDRSTVLGAMQNDIKSLGGDVASLTYTATMTALRNRLDETIKERDQLQADAAKNRATILALQGQYQQTVAEQKKDADGARNDLRGQIATYEERIATKDSEITQLNRDYSDVQLQLEQQKEAYVTLKSDLESRIGRLTQINDLLREKLDLINQASFERPDGEVRWVDTAGGFAWINLGSADSLPTRITFSIYPKNNSGVGRGQEDAKGAVEVTKILGPHLAEVRILDAKLGDPIAPGDAIYTPLWEPGRRESFSFVGLIDFDQDGQSDRQQLHDLVTSQGAIIDNEVNDAGEYTGNGISVNTRFLVIGEIPDVSGLPQDSRDAEQFGEMTKHLKDLRQQAREQGVRIVSLGDFLQYIGYRPKQRLFIPGSPTAQNRLRVGGREASVSKPILGRYGASGVSGAFDASRTGTNDRVTDEGALAR